MTATADSRADVVYTYRIISRGGLVNDVDAFAARAGRVLDDPRGWTLGGAVTFQRVSSDEDFTLVLASPQEVEAAHEVCSPQYSCRVDTHIYINDDNWRHATPAWREAGGDLTTYRQYLINHEVGHYLGFDHRDCRGTGRPARVMQQQSISLDGCEPRGWPTSGEREMLAERLDVPVRDPRQEPRQRHAVADDRVEEFAGSHTSTSNGGVPRLAEQGNASRFWASHRTISAWESFLGDRSATGPADLRSYQSDTDTPVLARSPVAAFATSGSSGFSAWRGPAARHAAGVTGVGPAGGNDLRTNIGLW